MIEALGTVLPIVIYLLLIVFLIVVIVLGIKIIITVDMINGIIQDVQRKIGTLDNVFRVMSSAADRLSGLGSKVVDSVISTVNRFIGGKRKDEDDYV